MAPRRSGARADRVGRRDATRAPLPPHGPARGCAGGRCGEGDAERLADDARARAKELREDTRELGTRAERLRDRLAERVRRTLDRIEKAIPSAGRLTRPPRRGDARLPATMPCLTGGTPVPGRGRGSSTGPDPSEADGRPEGAGGPPRGIRPGSTSCSPPATGWSPTSRRQGPTRGSGQVPQRGRRSEHRRLREAGPCLWLQASGAAASRAAISAVGSAAGRGGGAA